MNHKTNYWKSIMTVVATVWVLTVMSTTGFAQVIPPDQAQAMTGMNYAEWSVAWWQYYLSMPVTNPNNSTLDPTGKGCKATQPNGSPVFFLAGFGGDANNPVIYNECTVPAGKALFFPLATGFDVHVPGDGLDTPELVWEDLNKYFWGDVTGMFVDIDGVQVMDAVIRLYGPSCAGGPTTSPENCGAPPFSVTLPGNNLFVGSRKGGRPPGHPAIHGGIYAPAASIGYFLMLSPLSRGHHTVQFGSVLTVGGVDYPTNEIYNLIVK